MDISFIIIAHCSILRVPFRVPLRPTGYKPAPRRQEALVTWSLAARTAMVKHPFLNREALAATVSPVRSSTFFHSSISLGFMYDSLSTHARSGGVTTAPGQVTLIPPGAVAMRPETILILPHGGRRLDGDTRPPSSRLRAFVKQPSSVLLHSSLRPLGGRNKEVDSRPATCDSRSALPSQNLRHLCPSVDKNRAPLPQNLCGLCAFV